ncbi:acyl-homoserine-lactone synthase [Lichenihabitans psoromatis]|uniref:acyl-homoserine-lactone synthase n=1 Tax=Lichenihabitans psoromatis TaxID=2528642 RepID=UPI0010382FBA|nr:acyl-homoserine-lactone synthase [Lichenihabitans psoromatis]
MLKVIHGSEVSAHQELMDRVFRFRHGVFVDEKGWEDLRQPDARERDQFDDAHAIHQVCLRDDEIVGYQRLLPTTRPHLLTDVLADLCRTKTPRGPRVFEWTRFCVAPSHREVRPRANGAFLELAQGVVEWGIANRVATVTVAIDWRLMVIAMQLRFFVRPLGFPKKIGRDEVVALRMSFTGETLTTIRQARGCDGPVLEHPERQSAAA